MKAKYDKLKVQRLLSEGVEPREVEKRTGISMTKILLWDRELKRLDVKKYESHESYNLEYEEDGLMLD